MKVILPTVTPEDLEAFVTEAPVDTVVFVRSQYSDGYEDIYIKINEDTWRCLTELVTFGSYDSYDTWEEMDLDQALFAFSAGEPTVFVARYPEETK